MQRSNLGISRSVYLLRHTLPVKLRQCSNCLTPPPNFCSIYAYIQFYIPNSSWLITALRRTAKACWISCELCVNIIWRKVSPKVSSEYGLKWRVELYIQYGPVDVVEKRNFSFYQHINSYEKTAIAARWLCAKQRLQNVMEMMLFPEITLRPFIRHELTHAKWRLLRYETISCRSSEGPKSAHLSGETTVQEWARKALAQYITYNLRCTNTQK